MSNYDIPVAVYGRGQMSTGLGSWRTLIRRPMTSRVGRRPWPISAGEKLLDRMIDRMRNIEACRDILAKISPAAWVDPNPTNDDPEYDDRYLADAWGRPIVVVFPGRDWYTGARKNFNTNDSELTRRLTPRQGRHHSNLRGAGLWTCSRAADLLHEFRPRPAVRLCRADPAGHRTI